MKNTRLEVSHELLTLAICLAHSRCSRNIYGWSVYKLVTTFIITHAKRVLLEIYLIFMIVRCASIGLYYFVSYKCLWEIYLRQVKLLFLFVELKNILFTIVRTFGFIIDDDKLSSTDLFFPFNISTWRILLAQELASKIINSVTC